MALQLLVLRQITLPRSVEVAPQSWRTEQDVGAGVGLPRRKAEGRWPVERSPLCWRCMEVFSSSCCHVQVTSFMSPPPSAACKLPFSVLSILLSVSWIRALTTCSQAAGGLLAVVLLALPSKDCGTAPTSSASFSIHFVSSNHKRMREAESFVQVDHKARPPEVFKCGLEGE